MKGVQCYELFGGIALKNHAFSFFSFLSVNEFDFLIDLILRVLCFLWENMMSGGHSIHYLPNLVHYWSFSVFVGHSTRQLPNPVQYWSFSVYVGHSTHKLPNHVQYW